VELRIGDVGYSSGSRVYATFDLSTGTVGTIGSVTATNTSQSIASVGNGFYRISVTATLSVTSTTTFAFVSLRTSTSALSAGESYTGDGYSGLYIWGAQLETGAVATTYIRTEAVSTSAPRFDYDPITLAAKGLLIEESRANLLTYSEQFNDVIWTKNAATITANSAVSPDGTVDGDKLIATSTLNEHFVTQPLSYTSGTSYTLSAYAKADGYDFLQLAFGSGAFGAVTRAYFDLVTGTVGTLINSPIASIAPAGNGWYRCSITKTATATATANTLITVTPADNILTFTGDNVSGIYLWGAQSEAGAFPTSYIPTIASQVTRAADNASMTGTNFSSWYNQTEGTFYANWILGGDITGVCVYLASDGTGDNLIRLRYGTSGTANDCAVITATFVQATLSLTSQLVVYTTYKNAMAYKLDDFARSADGATVIVDSSGTPPTVTTFNIGSSYTSVEQLNGHIKQIAYYPRRLTNAELQSITA
jgi:hypothetical protein